MIYGILERSYGFCIKGNIRGKTSQGNMDEFQTRAEQKQLEVQRGTNWIIYVYEVLRTAEMVLEIRTVVVSGVEVGVTGKEQKELSRVTKVFCILTEMWVTRVNAFGKPH